MGEVSRAQKEDDRGHLSIQYSLVYALLLCPGIPISAITACMSLSILPYLFRYRQSLYLPLKGREEERWIYLKVEYRWREKVRSVTTTKKRSFLYLPFLVK
jgi:hypothetical protein